MVQNYILPEQFIRSRIDIRLCASGNCTFARQNGGIAPAKKMNDVSTEADHLKFAVKMK